ncbi:MAG TPA: S8 family serine peptidase [Thermomicrobiales bacterium]|nr:S8 family serine peptidase [Thermomicrobiales bacterium]
MRAMAASKSEARHVLAPAFLVLALVWSLFGVVVTPVQAAPAGSRPGEVVLLLRPGATATAVASALSQRHAAMRAVSAGRSGRVMLAHVPPGREVEFRDELRADPAVEAASLDYIVHATADFTPNDPDFPQQWDMTAVDAPAAWGAGARASGVTVAVIDTGADYNHPDLSAALLPGCNFVVTVPATCGPTAAQDDNNHGTHVSGTIAALTNNGLGVAGLAWGARILPLKALDATGSGSWFAITDAITYAAQQPGVRAINLSLGSDPGLPPDSSAVALLQNAVDTARQQGITVVAAAGNSGVNIDTTPVYPASLRGVVAVTAVDQNGAKPAWANYGTTVVVAAPGVSVLSTIINGYGLMSGTSMATPHVTALAALLCAAVPALQPDNVTRLLEQTATDLGPPGPDATYGWGRIDVAAALAAARPTFSDVPPGNPYFTAVEQLAARGITEGYGNGQFGPSDLAIRAQMAAFIARSLGWEAQNWGNPFSDQSGVDNVLWRDVGTLAHYNVARGYGDGTFRPRGPVLHVQTASFIARALVTAGYWQPQPDDPTIYPNVPLSSGGRLDLITYVHYAGALPDRPVNAAWSDWNTPATRGWFAQVLWQALAATPGP